MNSSYLTRFIGLIVQNVIKLRIVGATSFASAQKTTVKEEVSSTEARMTDAVTTVHALPIVCDVVMKKYQAGASWCKETDFNKVDHTTNRFTDFWFLKGSDVSGIVGGSTFSPGDPEIKNYGMFRSQQYHQCDVIIAPIYSFRTASQDEKQLRGADFVIVISGYAADYVNYRAAKEDDLNLIEHNERIKGGFNNGEVIAPDVVKSRN